MVGNGNWIATVLLGMPGFELLDAMVVSGELRVRVETAAAMTGCPECGARAVGHGRQLTLVRDLPVGDLPAVLVWSKRRWRCPDGDCGRGTWVERSDLIGSRSVLTDRARRHICEQVGAKGRPVAHLAGELGVGWHTAMGAVREHGHRLVGSLGDTPPTAVGMDDHNFARGRHDRRAQWSTAVVNLDTGKVIDVFAGRDTAQVRAWLDDRGDEWCAAVRTLSIDPHEGYRSAARGRPATGVEARLPGAVIVADPFHVVTIFNDRLVRTRLRVQRHTTGRRGQHDDPLYGIRRPLLVGYERLSDSARARIAAGLAAGDPDGHVTEAWSIKEQARAIYALPAELAEQSYDHLVERCRASRVPEIRSLVRTLRSWRWEVLAHHRHLVTNALLEATNLGIELLVRTARGFRNYGNYRLRVLLRLGVQWHTPPTTRIRGHQPRSTA